MFQSSSVPSSPRIGIALALLFFSFRNIYESFQQQVLHSGQGDQRRRDDGWKPSELESPDDHHHHHHQQQQQGQQGQPKQQRKNWDTEIRFCDACEGATLRLSIDSKSYRDASMVAADLGTSSSSSSSSSSSTVIHSNITCADLMRYKVDQHVDPITIGKLQLLQDEVSSLYGGCMSCASRSKTFTTTMTTTTTTNGNNNGNNNNDNNADRRRGRASKPSATKTTTTTTTTTRTAEACASDIVVKKIGYDEAAPPVLAAVTPSLRSLPREYRIPHDVLADRDSTDDYIAGHFTNASRYALFTFNPSLVPVPPNVRREEPRASYLAAFRVSAHSGCIGDAYRYWDHMDVSFLALAVLDRNLSILRESIFDVNGALRIPGNRRLEDCRLFYLPWQRVSRKERRKRKQKRRRQQQRRRQRQRRKNRGQDVDRQEEEEEQQQQEEEEEERPELHLFLSSGMNVVPIHVSTRMNAAKGDDDDDDDETLRNYPFRVPYMGEEIREGNGTNHTSDDVNNHLDDGSAFFDFLRRRDDDDDDDRKFQPLVLRVPRRNSAMRIASDKLFEDKNYQFFPTEEFLGLTRRRRLEEEEEKKKEEERGDQNAEDSSSSSSSSSSNYFYMMEEWPEGPRELRHLEPDFDEMNVAPRENTKETPPPAYVGPEIDLGRKWRFRNRGRGSACCLRLNRSLWEDMIVVADRDGDGDINTTSSKNDDSTIEALLRDSPFLWFGIEHVQSLPKTLPDGTTPGSRAYVSRLYAFAPFAPYSLVARSGLFCLGFTSTPPPPSSPSSTSGSGIMMMDGLHGDDDDATTTEDPFARSSSVIPRSKILRLGDDDGMVYRECPKISYVSGMADWIDDEENRFVIGYGVNDCSPRFVVVSKRSVAERLFLPPNLWTTTTRRRATATTTTTTT